jgi:orotidine-5''-phosphate decarboxylase (EC 4.1.1.23)
MAEIVIALDFPTTNEALALAGKLKGKGLWMKVGMELFTLGGPDIVKALQDMDYKVFLDLKFHDIPNTVRGGVESAASLGAGLTTIHICGGEAMCRAAAEAQKACGAKVTVLGVTVLTSLGPDELGEEFKAYNAPGCKDFVPSPGEVAMNRAVSAKQWGLKGIVCSPHEIAQIKKACGKDFLCLTPGIRLAGGAAQDQKTNHDPGRSRKAWLRLSGHRPRHYRRPRPGEGLRSGV